MQHIKKVDKLPVITVTRGVKKKKTQSLALFHSAEAFQIRSLHSNSHPSLSKKSFLIL